MKTAIKYSFVFWVIFFVVIVFLLSPTGDMDIVMIRVSSFILPQLVLFYFNMLVLLPYYFEKQRKGIYYTVLFSIVIGASVLLGYLNVYMDRVIPLDINKYHGNSVVLEIFGRMMSFVPAIIIGALMRKSFLLQQKTKESLELQNKMLAAETNALKAQINPHFLFNTLNNIYSLSQFNSKKTGEAILQLSDILRYVTYEGDKKTVLLSAELEHIKSFIKLQKLKDEDDSNISIDISIDTDTLRISPLLLIPFVENSFKHSNHYNKESGWIKIRIRNIDSQLILEVSNSVGECLCPKDNVGGIGMENVKKRLSLLYPYKHELVLKMNRYSYGSTLKINL